MKSKETFVLLSEGSIRGFSDGQIKKLDSILNRGEDYGMLEHLPCFFSEKAANFAINQMQLDARVVNAGESIGRFVSQYFGGEFQFLPEDRNDLTNPGYNAEQCEYPITLNDLEFEKLCRVVKAICFWKFGFNLYQEGGYEDSTRFGRADFYGLTEFSIPGYYDTKEAGKKFHVKVERTSLIKDKKTVLFNGAIEYANAAVQIDAVLSLVGLAS